MIKSKNKIQSQVRGIPLALYAFSPCEYTHDIFCFPKKKTNLQLQKNWPTTVTTMIPKKTKKMETKSNRTIASAFFNNFEFYDNEKQVKK